MGCLSSTIMFTPETKPLMALLHKNAERLILL